MSLSTYRVPIVPGLSLPLKAAIVFLLVVNALEFAGFAILKSAMPDFATRFASPDGTIPLPLKIHMKFDRALAPIGGTYAMVFVLLLALVLVLALWKTSPERSPR